MLAVMLASSKLVAFAPTVDMAAAQRFYGTVLGLRAVDANPFATVYDANGTMLRVTAVEVLTPHPFTVLGWEVADIASAIDGLVAAGVAFQRFDGMTQDERGIWTTPGGEQVAWFHDPDGNTLSLTQFG